MNYLQSDFLLMWLAASPAFALDEFDTKGCTDCLAGMERFPGRSLPVSKGKV